MPIHRATCEIGFDQGRLLAPGDSRVTQRGGANALSKLERPIGAPGRTPCTQTYAMRCSVATVRKSPSRRNFGSVRSATNPGPEMCASSRRPPTSRMPWRSSDSVAPTTPSASCDGSWPFSRSGKRRARTSARAMSWRRAPDGPLSVSPACDGSIRGEDGHDVVD